MRAVKQLCIAFSDLLAATEPESREPRQTMLTAASQVRKINQIISSLSKHGCLCFHQVGNATHKVLYTIGEEEVVNKERQDNLLGRAKEVANATADLVLKAKNVASKCPDQHSQNRVIGAATHCALATSQIVACAKVVAPTVSDQICQEQLVEAAREVFKSVDGCVSVSADVSDDLESLKKLEGSAQKVSKALNELLIHVKEGQQDKIPGDLEFKKTFVMFLVMNLKALWLNVCRL
jgi:talin